MLVNHEQRWAWPGTLSFSHSPSLPPLSLCLSDSLAHPLPSRGSTPQSVNPPQKGEGGSCSSVDCRQSESPHPHRQEEEESAKKKAAADRKNPHSQGCSFSSAGEKQPGKHSSKLIVILNEPPSLCFLFGAELLPL